MLKHVHIGVRRVGIQIERPPISHVSAYTCHLSPCLYTTHLVDIKRLRSKHNGAVIRIVSVLCTSTMEQVLQLTSARRQ